MIRIRFFGDMVVVIICYSSHLHVNALIVQWKQYLQWIQCLRLSTQYMTRITSRLPGGTIPYAVRLIFNLFSQDGKCGTWPCFHCGTVLLVGPALRTPRLILCVCAVNMRADCAVNLVVHPTCEADGSAFTLCSVYAEMSTVHIAPIVLQYN